MKVLIDLIKHCIDSIKDLNILVSIFSLFICAGVLIGSYKIIMVLMGNINKKDHIVTDLTDQVSAYNKIMKKFYSLLNISNKGG